MESNDSATLAHLVKLVVGLPVEGHLIAQRLMEKLRVRTPSSMMNVRAVLRDSRVCGSCSMPWCFAQYSVRVRNEAPSQSSATKNSTLSSCTKPRRLPNSTLILLCSVSGKETRLPVKMPTSNDKFAAITDDCEHVLEDSVDTGSPTIRSDGRTDEDVLPNKRATSSSAADDCEHSSANGLLDLGTIRQKSSRKKTRRRSLQKRSAGLCISALSPSLPVAGGLACSSVEPDISATEGYPNPAESTGIGISNAIPNTPNTPKNRLSESSELLVSVDGVCSDNVSSIPLKKSRKTGSEGHSSMPGQLANSTPVRSGSLSSFTKDLARSTQCMERSSRTSGSGVKATQSQSSGHRKALQRAAARAGKSPVVSGLMKFLSET